jgi:hypothetical protein
MTPIKYWVRFRAIISGSEIVEDGATEVTRGKVMSGMADVQDVANALIMGFAKKHNVAPMDVQITIYGWQRFEDENAIQIVPPGRIIADRYQ